VGELDIDSHVLSPFGREDVELLEAICILVSRLFYRALRQSPGVK
jgi:putative methionine-R-sulfoxide reductase with GAF domain